MPSIPHSYTAALTSYAPAIVAFVIAIVLPLLGRGKGLAATAAPLALFAGWALLIPVVLLPRVVWAPHRGVESLLAPALACVAAGMITGRPRLVAVALAGFAGWWVARDWAGQTDFWRVWAAVALLAALVGWVAGSAERILVVAVALWGGLAVAGAGAGWAMAALVVAGGAAGLLVASVPASVPAAAVAALIGAADLAGGRLLRGRVEVIDVACIAALLAPMVADAAAAKLGLRGGRLATLPASAMGAGAAMVAVWLIRRAFFT